MHFAADPSCTDLARAATAFRMHLSFEGIVHARGGRGEVRPQRRGVVRPVRAAIPFGHLVLRDVLGCRASETAELLGKSEDTVASAL